MQKRILLLLPQYDSDSSDLAKLIMGPALIKTVVTEYVYSVDVLMRYELIGDSEVRWCKTMGGFLFSSWTQLQETLAQKVIMFRLFKNGEW